MKSKLSLLLIALVIFSSCKTTLYTHDQVMSRYKTKDDIIAKFGLPAEKRQGENIEEWIYDFGTISKGRGTGVAYRGIAISSNQYDNYQKFIKFTFDANGRLLKWDTQGVDFTEKKTDTGKTIIAVVLGTALTVALCIAAANAGAAAGSSGY